MAQAYEYALGVKSMRLSPGLGQFLAVGSYDQHVRLLSTVSWRPVADYDCPARLNAEAVTVFREQLDSRDSLMDALRPRTAGDSACFVSAVFLSICMYVCQSVCLSICLVACLPACVSIITLYV